MNCLSAAFAAGDLNICCLKEAACCLQLVMFAFGFGMWFIEKATKYCLKVRIRKRKRREANKETEREVIIQNAPVNEKQQRMSVMTSQKSLQPNFGKG